MSKEHGDDRRDEEHQRSNDRALTETRDATDAVAAGATRTKSSAETQQEPRYYQDRQRNLYVDGEGYTSRQHVDEGAEQKAHDEHRSPPDFRALRGQQSADDAADPGDASVKEN